jgi:type I site-specific restriction endonuclease
MNEAETRAELIDPALKAAGWGVVEASRVRREEITLAACRSEMRRDEASDCRSFVATACIRGVCGLSDGQKRLLDR